MKPTNEDFMAAAFVHRSDEEAAWVTGFPGCPFAAQGYLWAGRPVHDNLPFIVQPEHNNYVCISTFHVGADGWHRRKANFAGIHAVMIDDIGTKVPRERIVLEPSVEVETSPGNFQAWYFLYPPDSDAKRADHLLQQLIASGLSKDGRDPGMRGVTRYGRLPVGVNGKRAYVERLGKPFVQRVHVWELDRRYQVNELASAYGLDLVPPRVKQARRRALRGDVDTLVAALEELGLYTEGMDSIPGGHRIICPWHHEHTGGDLSGTTYFEPSDFNDWYGGFKCHHGHCEHRGIKDLRRFIRAAKRMSEAKAGRAA